MSAKETVEMIANIAIAVGVIFSTVMIILNLRSLRYMRRTYQADLFFKIASSIDEIVREQKEIEKKGVEVVENWYERIFNVLDDFCFIANRKMITREMIEHFIPTVIDYCNDANEYSESLRQKLKEGDFNEIKKVFEKNAGKVFPF